MPEKQTRKKSDQADEQNFTAVGVVFFVAGAGMIAVEATRAVGIPFLILGATFFALGQKDSSKDKK